VYTDGSVVPGVLVLASNWFVPSVTAINFDNAASEAILALDRVALLFVSGTSFLDSGVGGFTEMLGMVFVRGVDLNVGDFGLGVGFLPSLGVVPRDLFSVFERNSLFWRTGLTSSCLLPLPLAY